MTIYGYARVSTDGQSLASQDAQLHAADCAKVYSEKISGARSDRPELAKLLKRLGQGDVLVVTRLDYSRPAQHPRSGCQGRRRLQVAGRDLGRHHDGARPADADHSRRPSRVRARADPCPHERRQKPRKGPWSEIRPSRGSDRTPA